MTPLRYSVAEISKQDIYKDGVPVGFPKGAPAKCCRLVVWQFAHCHIAIDVFCEGTWQVEVFFLYSRHTHTKYVYLQFFVTFLGWWVHVTLFRGWFHADLYHESGIKLGFGTTSNGTQDTLLWFCGTLGMFWVSQNTTWFRWWFQTFLFSRRTLGKIIQSN